MKSKYRNIGVVSICLFIILACIIPRTATTPLEQESETQTGMESAAAESLPLVVTVDPDIQPADVQTESPQETELPQETESPMTYLGQYYVTGYDICVKCCGKTDGITASGTVATVGRTVGCNSLPFGTRLYIDGIGERVVEDRGGMKSIVLDVLCNDHPECYAITGYYDVYIINE